MPSEKQVSVKVWAATMKDIETLAKRLTAERHLPKGMTVSKAEVIHLAVQAMKATTPGVRGDTNSPTGARSE